MEIAELSRSAPRSGRGGRRFKSCHSDQLLMTSTAYGASYGERNPLASLLGARPTSPSGRSPRCVARQRLPYFGLRQAELPGDL
jgi:hypothetical protein